MALTPRQTIEGFSLSHAAILSGSTGLEESFGDIYGVREGSLAADIGNFDNTGDDSVLSTWLWFNFATVTVTGGYIPFEMVALLTGGTITSSGSDPNDYYSLPLWTETSLNQPVRPMLIRVPAKDSAGEPRNLDIILYRVQFNPINFDGPSYKNGLTVNYSGKALMSSTDETGSTLADRAIGRLIDRPQV